MQTEANKEKASKTSTSRTRSSPAASNSKTASKTMMMELGLMRSWGKTIQNF
jgi:hypothetical protein